MASYIQYEVSRRTAHITMNRPEKRNALNSAMVKELAEAFYRACQDKEVRTIMLSGNGNTFSAGADLDELKLLQTRSYNDNLADSHSLMELYSRIYHAEKPVIARVEGAAIAGGCGLAVCCDFCYCTPDAEFGFPEVRIGFIPALVSVFLLRKIGESATREMLLSGRKVNAARAVETGIAHAVFPSETIREQTDRLCEDLSVGVSENSIRLTKLLISAVREMDLKDALDYAAAMNAECRSSEDCKKGISAFLSGQKSSW